jgi:hypothetical protein
MRINNEFDTINSFCIAILNIIAWVLLASAGVMIARYFDTVWPEYEQVVVEGNGVVRREQIRQRRRVSYFTVIHFFAFFEF